MNAKDTFTASSRRTLIALVFAASLALSTIYGQAVLSSLTGIALTATAHACEGHTGGC